MAKALEYDISLQTMLEISLASQETTPSFQQSSFTVGKKKIWVLAPKAMKVK
jgi:hypothetical protein